MAVIVAIGFMLEAKATHLQMTISSLQLGLEFIGAFAEFLDLLLRCDLLRPMRSVHEFQLPLQLLK